MISDSLRQEIAVIGILHILAIVIALVFLMTFLIQARRDYAVKAFLLMQVSIIFWMIFKIFKTVSPNETLRWSFIVAYYFCICLFEVTFFEFAFSYYKGRPAKKMFRYVLYAVATTQFLWVLTNPWHHLFYATYDFWSDSFGPLFFVHSAIAYALLLVGVVYCSLTFRRHFVGTALWYKMALAAAMLSPLLFNYLFISGSIESVLNLFGVDFRFDTDITPLVFIFSTSVFMYATFNHKILDLSPIMKHEIVHQLDTAICVLNRSGRVVYANEKAMQSFGKMAKRRLERALKQFKFAELRAAKAELIIEREVYNVFIQPVNGVINKQYIVRFNNISDYKKVEADILNEQAALNDTNRALQTIIEQLKKGSRIGAREYVARELHDIIGHSLVVAIKALEVTKMYHRIDRLASQKALADSAKVLQNGIASMGDVHSGEARLYGETLQRDIEEMLSRVNSGAIKTRFIFKGSQLLIDGQIYDIINRICLELVTNSLKHGQVNELFLSIALRGHAIELLYIDDGVGCVKLNEGNGLRGIRKRLAQVDGRADFICPEGVGFTAKISIEF